MQAGKTFKPQPSERWAMYRLICPAVDEACAISGLEAYFEYSTPNGPNHRLSADIALLRDGKPIWIIEAKKYGRHIEPGMVDAYLVNGAMGAISNGNHWIFKIAGRYLNFGPLLRTDGSLDDDLYRKLVSIMSATDEATALAHSDAWTDAWSKPTETIHSTIWVESGGKGERSFLAKTTFSSLQDAASAARCHAKDGSMTASFLDEIVAEGSEIPTGHLEVSEARLIWWMKPNVRGVRLKLRGRQMEMLVHNTLLDAFGRDRVSAAIKMHDQNTSMSVLKASVPTEVAGLSAIFGVAGDG